MKNTESLNGNTNAGGTINKQYGKEIITYQEIKDTPFTIVTHIDHGSWLAIGNSRVSEIVEDKEDLYTYMEQKSWGLLGAVIATVVDKIIDLKEENKRLKEKETKLKEEEEEQYGI